jgi:hypothetical protein
MKTLVNNKDGAETRRRPKMYFPEFFISIRAEWKFSGAARVTFLEGLTELERPDVQRIAEAWTSPHQKPIARQWKAGTRSGLSIAGGRHD